LYADHPLYLQFRELNQRKTCIPKHFHNWLHWITEAPPVPAEEVMRGSIQAEKTARALVSTVDLAVRLSRKPGIPERKLSQELDKALGSYALTMDDVRAIPGEFQLLPVSELGVETVDDLLAVSKKLGKRALRHPPIRHRSIREAS
jgi:hypothetical protein